jgi:hypothetical protein
MLVEAPPSRYKIVERNRRLITIDTQSGLEVGAMQAAPPAAPSQLQSGTSAPAPDLSKTAALPKADAAPDRRRSALLSARPALQPLARISTAQAPKIAILVLGIILVGTILIMSNLWPIALIPVFVPAIRQKLWPVVARAIVRWLNDDTA